MADNINSINNCDDEKCSPSTIDENRLKEIKAMEEAEQRLIEDLFSSQSNIYVKDKAVPVNNLTKQVKNLNKHGKLKS
jgi:hypothetical protein